jgi:hypothetical protein
VSQKLYKLEVALARDAEVGRHELHIGRVVDSGLDSSHVWDRSDLRMRVMSAEQLAVDEQRFDRSLTLDVIE